MKLSEILAKHRTAGAIHGAETEGGWSHKYVISPEGVLGLDSSEHRNEGYKLVQLPKKIEGALRSTGLLKKDKIKFVTLYDNYWAIGFPNGVFEVHNHDLNKLNESGMDGIRVDSDQTIVYFK